MSLRLLGGLCAALLGAGSALLEAMATPLHPAIPIAAAVLGNIFLIWFARSTLERSWSWAVPGLPWFIVFVAMISPTGDGDRIADTWVGLVAFGAGAFTYFVAISTRPIKRPIVGVSGISR